MWTGGQQQQKKKNTTSDGVLSRVRVRVRGCGVHEIGRSVSVVHGGRSTSVSGLAQGGGHCTEAQSGQPLYVTPGFLWLHFPTTSTLLPTIHYYIHSLYARRLPRRYRRIRRYLLIYLGRTYLEDYVL